MSDSARIYVSVASFCDPELQFTLLSLFDSATNPQALAVAVVDQSEDENRAWLAEQPFYKQVRYVQINPVDSRGVCWARSLAFSFYQGEEYLLQVDSHTWFEPGWDVQLIEQLQSLLAQAEKPLITAYPPPFRFDETGQPAQAYAKGTSVYRLRPKTDAQLTAQSLKLSFVVAHQQSEHDFEVGHHVAGGFIFTLGRLTQDVPYDPSLYFHGEEQDLAIRAYSRGYTIFHPRHDLIPLMHLYKTAGEEHRGQHWRADLERRRTFSFGDLMQRADWRLQQVLLGDSNTGVFGVGMDRPLQSFYDESGLNYPELTVRDAQPMRHPDALAMCNTRHGPMMVIRRDESIGYSLRTCGQWAPGVLNLALQHIQLGQTVIEVGSTYGEHAVPLMRRLGRTGRLVAIEPNPVLFRLLSTNLILNQSLEALPIQAAIVDQAGQMAVQSLSVDKACHASRVRLAESADEVATAVQAMQVDELGLTRLDLLKINVNGMERLVLQGAVITCQTLRPIVMLTGEALDMNFVRDWAQQVSYQVEHFHFPAHAVDRVAPSNVWNPLLECALLKPQ